MDILNFGSLNIDYVYRVDKFLEAGETKLSKELKLFCGGKGLNQSIAMARAGNTVYHAGLMGEDGQMLREKLEENGVRTEYLKPVSGKSGHAIIQVADSGQNCILLYGGANQALTEEYIDSVLECFDPGTMLLIQNELNLTDHIIEKAASLSIPVAMNAAPMDEKVLSYPLEKLTWLMVNEVEGRALAGVERDEDIIPALTARYPGLNILLTLGHRGSMCHMGGRTVFCEALKVQAVDTTAAGDTFNGYFLRGILSGMPVEMCMELAATAAAICVTREGASDSVPMASEVEEAMMEGMMGRPRTREL
ncbi:MAG: ribokinase [Clostridia bacterium]|nr:ribokinase [Clostridia bacterium]MBQ6704300.1 ribokinase [Clostridia bacterium]